MGLTTEGVWLSQPYTRCQKLIHPLRSAAVYNRWTDGLDWTGLDWTGLDWTGLDWTGLDWTGMDWTGLDWTGLVDWTAANSVSLNLHD